MKKPLNSYILIGYLLMFVAAFLAGALVASFNVIVFLAMLFTLVIGYLYITKGFRIQASQPRDVDS